jgi:FkbM family methyltransferase
MSIPKLSVCMITYGHEAYIIDALKGVLMQKTTFEFEVVLAEDCSPDATQEVVRSFLQQHPRSNKVKYIRHAVNKGMMDNFIWALNQCRGEYIAICEGDDYWIDPLKLERQIAILEQNPSHSFCFHQGIRFGEDESTYDVYPLNKQQTTFLPSEIFNMTTIPMASVVFRSSIPRTFVRGHSHPDFQLLCSLMTRGEAYFLKEVMSVYRVHPGGVSYNHFTVKYLEKRLSDLLAEATMPQFSDAVQKEIAHAYVVHVLLLTQNFRQELTSGQIMGYLSNSISLRKRKGSYFNEYKQIFSSLSPLVAKFSSLFNIKQMKHFLKLVYDKLTIRGFRDQLLHETKTTQNELAILREQLFTNNPVMVVGNMKICLPLFYADHIQKIIYQSRNYYELETLGFLRTHYKQFDHIIDIGSNIGNHMLYYCNYLAPKKVYCFEPNLFNRNQLEQNVLINHLNKVVTVYPFALGATIGKGLQTNFSLGNTGMNRIDTFSDADSDEEAVDIRSLDSLNIPQANFMKIDVEGFEVEVLKGAGEMIKRCKPVVMVEVFETNRPEVEALMQGYGYKKFITLEDYNSIYVPL